MGFRVAADTNLKANSEQITFLIKMSQVITARLSRNDAQPWGFRLQGGKDFGTPLVIQKYFGV
ncbi:CLUMA_CG008534, isoform A [Clunio marinus]|uniref:CLUMA_CG008534, isoform A n=1 Tax=Clunio marinus TaxID=568069 RepID=A0A1J1I4D0_9DIPT|nr:CLUMA_CG008534, isoform A [Clunio marinus]